MSFELNKVKGANFYTSSVLNYTGSAKHFFSTRIEGISPGPYQSLNLGIYTSDSEENIYENYKRIFNQVGMNIDGLCYLYQVHGDACHLVDNDNLKQVSGRDGDALITTSKGVAIGVMTADCIPVLLLDPVRGCAAAVHAGWKGTSFDIVKKVVNNMIEEQGCLVENIYAAIGPGIGPCCFEVGEDVAQKFKFTRIEHGKFFVDLWKENEYQLLSAGISSGRVDKIELCTMCSRELFFSYRGEGGLTGRMGSFIELV